MRTTLLLILLLMQAPVEARTEVFRWVDETGVVHFGDRPPALDRGRRIRVREPNLMDSVETSGAAVRPTQPSSRPRPVGEEPDELALSRLRCDEARDRQRSLRAKRRSGYALADARALDREADEIAAAIRSSCR